MTPIGFRLRSSLNDEYRRMQNEWFFKWHHIGGQRVVEIESYRGKPITYAGIRFSGSARLVYWDTIQHYITKKIGSIFDDLEEELKRYPLEIRVEALTEAAALVSQFVEQIRRAAIEKDRILRGDGLKFPPPDPSSWRGGHAGEINLRVEGLRRIYCDLKQDVGGAEMSLQSLIQDKVTLVKRDGTVVRTNIPASVAAGQITTFAVDLPIEVDDHFLRQLPNGLVDDYVVYDPGYHSGIAGATQPHYQAKVRRSDAPPAPPQTIIANFHGANSRLNVNSTDNSINIVTGITGDQLTEFIQKVGDNMHGLPEECQRSMQPSLSILESEAQSVAPSQSNIRGALLAIKRVAEGAAGNLVAASISALIAQMLR